MGKSYSLHVDSEELDEVMKYVSQYGIVTLESAPPTLEDLFMRHYEGAASRFRSRRCSLMEISFYDKTGMLSRFIVRRDRLRISIWLFSLAAFTFVVAQTFTDLYATEEERQAIAETMLNPAMTAMVGPAYGIDNYTIGAMFAHEMLLFTAIAFGLMSILLVARHTRADEEDGRIEMIRSLPTGRLSNLASTVVVVSGVNILFAILIGFGLYVMGIESMDLEGSLLYGAALGATGIFFTAVTAIFAQLSENARGTIGFAFTVLGVSYLVRAVGDVGNETLFLVFAVRLGVKFRSLCE